MKTVKLSLVLTAILLSAKAAALNSGWTDIVTIYTPITGQPFVTFSSGALPGCYKDAAAYLPITTDNGKGQLAYSTLLAAQNTKKQVRIYYTLNPVDLDYTGWGLCNINAVSIH